MVKLGCSFSGKLGKDCGAQDGATADSIPLIGPLDVSQLQPSFSDQVRGLPQPTPGAHRYGVRFTWTRPPVPTAVWPGLVTAASPAHLPRPPALGLSLW